MIVAELSIKLNINQIIKMKTGEVNEKRILLSSEFFFPITTASTSIIAIYVAVFDLFTLKMIPLPAHITKNPIDF